MYFQFLIEDQSSGIVVNHVMEKIKLCHEGAEIFWNIKTFTGIGNLGKSGSVLERKTGKLLNDLPMYLRGFDKKLRQMPDAAIIIVLDNDKRELEEFKNTLEEIAAYNMILSDYAFCLAVKEVEAWLLGDREAILAAYPNAKILYLRQYVQDSICDTWEVLADIVYPQGFLGLKKKAGGSYSEIGKAKCEWADRIGGKMNLYTNNSPSFCRFIDELERRIQTF